MATIHERLSGSLQVLKEYQEKTKSGILHGKSTLGTTHTDRLVNNGYLQPIIKGWYMSSSPGSEGDTTVWYSAYWDFIAAYARERFGEQWTLSPDQSLAFYSGYYVAPKQLIIRATNGGNNVLSLPNGDSLFDMNCPVPKNIIKEPKYSLNTFSIAEALLFCTPQFFTQNQIEAQTCLQSLKDISDIISIAIDGGNSTRASRLVGALKAIGRDEFAEQIMSAMKRLGYDMRPENPFEGINLYKGPIIDRSPYCARIQLMWNRMRNDILSSNIPPAFIQEPKAILSGMDAEYVKDAYNSLSIEGYRVSAELIERVRSGEWNPKKIKADSEQKNALAARGYYQAFQLVRSSVSKILENEGSAGEIVAKNLQSWHFELFEPCVQTGIIKASDLYGYRNHSVYIRGSKHTPLPQESLVDAMQTFMTLLRNEDNAAVRAILGHFFFVYIHPYMDGNGRTARFILNAMLVTGGWPWTVVPLEKRKEYMTTLETASIEENIVPFAEFIFDLIRNSNSPETRK